MLLITLITILTIITMLTTTQTAMQWLMVSQMKMLARLVLKRASRTVRDKETKMAMEMEMHLVLVINLPF